MVRLSLISKAYFVKEDEGTSIENISKREASYQICSTALILATTLSTLPWTHPCMLELKQVPFLGMLLPKMFTTLYPKVAPFSPHSFFHSINSPLCSSGEGGSMDHSGSLTGYQVMHNQKKSPPLCRSH